MKSSFILQVHFEFGHQACIREVVGLRDQPFIAEASRELVSDHLLDLVNLPSTAALGFLIEPCLDQIPQLAFEASLVSNILVLRTFLEEQLTDEHPSTLVQEDTTDSTQPSTIEGLKPRDLMRAVLISVTILKCLSVDY